MKDITKRQLKQAQNAITNDILTIYANHVAGGDISWSELVYLQNQHDFILETPALATNAGLCEFAGIDEEIYQKNMSRFL
jgi:hypothetical protein